MIKDNQQAEQLNYQFAYTGLKNDGFTAKILALPSLLLLFVFLILPFLVAVGISFSDKRLLSPHESHFVGLDNYTRLLSVQIIAVNPKSSNNLANGFEYKGNHYQKVRDLIRSTPELSAYSMLYQFQLLNKQQLVLAKDPLFIQSLLNTFKFVVMVVPLQILGALFLALMLNGRGKIRLLFKLLFFAPVVTSMVVVCVVWSMIYQQHGGLLNSVLSMMSSSYQPVDWLRDPAWAMPALVVLSAWQGMGIQMLIILAGLQSIPHNLYEAAALDGANKWAQFFHITLPGLKNTLIVVVISTVIFAFALFVQVDVMTQGGPQDSTSTVLFYAIEKGFRQQQIAYGAAVCIFYFILIVALTLFQKRLLAHGKS
ncbi:sugar ABC transporter permease [Catenovulum sp. 2E275]|uniref:carbohydrate ABC transporter permease n=1 Tax=Catenovulum sp. 2E275 TaxID=2980497 RepID=UPI0021D2595F|nr:sugar ABC transporter permease [Catenovulum sp. 2E275]MCU4677020.1 sugar ABC transporter permease [Catenovulum sp. 2E275]